MKSRSTLGRLTYFSATRPWIIIGLWVVICTLAILITRTSLGSALTTSQEFTSKPDSQIAGDLLSEHFADSSTGGGELVVVRSRESATIDDEKFRIFITAAVAELRADPVVQSVVSFYETPSPSLISADRTTMLLPVNLRGDFEQQEKEADHLVEWVKETRDDQFEVRITGPATISQNFSEVSEKDLLKGELIGLPITLVILLIVFGAVVAALLPLGLSILAIVAAIGLTAFIGSRFSEFSFFVINMITMMGLAVGVDYSLFIVSRFREERMRNVEKIKAIVTAGTTAGRAVLFSGLTVVLALIGLYLVPMNIFQGLATGAIFVVVFAVLASMTLLPAILSLLGDRLNRGRIGRIRTEADPRGGFWDKLTNRIMADPIGGLLIAVIILGALAWPAKDLQIGASGIASMPRDLEARQAYELLREKFSVGLVAPATVVITGALNQSATVQAAERLQASLMADPMIGPSMIEPSTDGQALRIRFAINADATSQKALDAVDRLRSETIPTAFADTNTRQYLGGEAANNADFIALARDNTVPVFVFVLGLSFLLLMAVFRSIVVPLKAIAMNLLSVAAAYGLLVLVFQKGIGNELFGFTQVEKIEAWLPLFLFCVLFGLSMDYHVFLLSRIREHFTKTGDNAESVAYGVRTTASLITGAAFIMVAVFAAFAAGDLVMFQQMGFGMAVAILLDATIIRSVLVPASMKLLGERNWYFPPFLRWIPNISVEGEAQPPRGQRGRKRSSV